MSNERIKKTIQAGWDAMSDAYQAETRISLEDVHYGPLCPGERELRLIGDVRGKRVLELACGAAQNSIALANWGAHVTSMDFSARQLQKASQLVTREKANVRLLRGDMEDLGMFRDASFDLVLSSFGWEFVPDLAACLHQCSRVLRMGGLLVVCTVHPLSAFEWDPDQKALLVTDYFSLPVEVWDDLPEKGRGITIFHTIQEMFGLLASAGFAVESIVEPCPYPVPYMSDEEKKAIPFAGPYWERQYERLSRVPFSIVYKARKPPARQQRKRYAFDVRTVRSSRFSTSGRSSRPRPGSCGAYT